MTEIYYVEDDENISRAVETFLEQQGYNVSIFQTIADVKQAIKNMSGHGVSRLEHAGWEWQCTVSVDSVDL